jgi:hypothetical protein
MRSKQLLRSRRIDAAMRSMGILSELLFLWVTPTIRLGRKSPLQLSDQPACLSTLAGSSSARGPAFLSAYAATAPDSTPTSRAGRLLRRLGFSRTLRALAANFGAAYAHAAWGKPVWLGCALAQVFIVRSLVAFISDDNATTSRWAYLPACFGLFVTAQGMSVAQHSVFFHSTLSGAAAKSALVSALYRKAMRLGPSITSSIGVLHSIDVQRIVDCATYFHFVWFGFCVEIPAIMAILFLVLGPAAAFGLLVLLISIPLQLQMSRSIANYRAHVTERADDRVHAVDELLKGIRTVRHPLLTNVFICLDTRCL